jgi:hypothetical protein
MTTTVASIISKAATILQDTSNVRWTTSELIGWLNDGQRDLVALKPNANTKNIAVQLVQGTKQSLPSDAVTLLDVIRNMGTDGTTPGKSIRLVSREIIDNQVPDWHAITPDATVRHFMFTPFDPKNYYVYPPQPASSRGYVEILYSASPADCVSGGNISLDDVYATSLTNYVIAKAYAKDAEYANGAQSTAYMQLFTAMVQGKVAAETAVNPNKPLAELNPNNPGLAQ